MEARLHAIAFEAGTAFTNVRRIPILRRLTKGEAVTVRTLTKERSMSPPAVGRHTDKLISRGYVVSCSVGRSLCYRLAPGFKAAIHGKMFEIVCAQWGRK